MATNLRRLGAIVLGVTLCACAHEPTAPRRPGAADESTLAGAKAGGARYQLQFVVIDPATQGEITSAPFPDGGVTLNTRDPWRQLSVSGATLVLNNYTHGDWVAGTCASYSMSDVWVNWDIARTEPTRSFAGTWSGGLSIWSGRSGTNLAFEGVRSDGTPGAIRNVATNNNSVQQERGPGDEWFRIRFTNARMGFGSLSSPDGGVTLGELAGYEAACANFTIVATRLP